jgi:hypothetical protein
MTNIVIKFLLLLLKKKKKKINFWRDLSTERMVSSYGQLINKKKENYRTTILSFTLSALAFFLKFSFKKKKINQKKVSGNYYPIN